MVTREIRVVVRGGYGKKEALRQWLKRKGVKQWEELEGGYFRLSLKPLEIHEVRELRLGEVSEDWGEPSPLAPAVGGVQVGSLVEWESQCGLPVRGIVESMQGEMVTVLVIFINSPFRQKVPRSVLRIVDVDPWGD